jgi:hypothetical protein
MIYKLNKDRSRIKFLRLRLLFKIATSEHEMFSLG